MPLRIGKTTTNEESSNEKPSRNRFVLPVFLVILLAIFIIGSEQTGLKGFKGSELFPTFNSATLFKTSSSEPLNLDDLVDDEQEYLQWLLQERQKVANFTEYARTAPITVLYRAMAGLGHQLLRMSSAYHLLSIYQIPLLWPTENPVCGGTIFTIYEYLIGPGPILVDIPYLKPHNSYDKAFILPMKFPKMEYVNEAELTDEERQSLKRSINLNNEVPKYSHAMGSVWEYDLPRFERMQYFYKDQTDYQLYHQLMLSTHAIGSTFGL